jgi:hypothetical protein
MSGHKNSEHSECPPPLISISSHRSCPWKLRWQELHSAAVCRCRTPSPPPSSPATASRHRHVACHRCTPDHSQGWVIGILSLFLSYLWMMSTSAAKTRFILDIAKTFLSLWILLDVGYCLGKFLDLVYRINLGASGVSCMSPEWSGVNNIDIDWLWLCFFCFSLWDICTNLQFLHALCSFWEIMLRTEETEE